MTNHGPFSLSDLTSYGIAAGYAERGDRVRWLRETDDDVREGTARSIGDERGCVAWGVDIRDQFLRITSVTGFEHFLPMAEVAEMVREGRIGPA